MAPLLVSLSFLSDLPLYLKEKPYTVYGPVPPGFQASNCEFRTHSGIPIEDIRQGGHQFTVDSAGFEFLSAPSVVSPRIADFHASGGDQEKTAAYLNETKELVRKYFGAEKVICFDWRVRSNASDQVAGEMVLSGNRSESLAPASIAHSDYSPQGGLARMKRQLTPTELTQFDLRDFRVRIVNVWRPLVDTVVDAPLAFCDPRSLSKKDLLEEDKVHPDHWEEGLFPLYRPSQKWFYLAGQSKDEIALFATWDSDFLSDADTIVCPPHASFQNPHGDGGLPPRESVEVRMLVICRKAH